MPPTTAEQGVPQPPLDHAKTSWYKKPFTFFLLFIVLLLAGYYFVYHTNTYIKLASHRLEEGRAPSGRPEGFYEVRYPTHKTIVYLNFPGFGFIEPLFFRDLDFKTYAILTGYYIRDHTKVYTLERDEMGYGLSLPIPEGAGVKVLGKYYLAIGDKVYFRATEIKGAHPSDFTFLEEENLVFAYSGDRTGKGEVVERFTRSQGTIYFGAEPALIQRDGTFIRSITRTKIPCEFFGTQDESRGENICKITPDGKDTPVEVATAGFNIMYSDPLMMYAKDARHVYIGFRYSCGMYCGTLHVVEGADPTTFSLSPEGAASDVHGTYRSGCKLFPEEVDAEAVTRREGSSSELGHCHYF